MIFDHGNRVLRGSVHWCEIPECGGELEDLKAIDRFAWLGMQDLIEDAAGNGVDADESQVRCPLGFTPPKAHNPPWLGEFKVLGKAGRRHWRLYFGEPTNYQDHVVRVRVWSKRSNWTRAETQQRERDAIAQAMSRLKWYFSKQGYEWSQF